MFCVNCGHELPAGARFCNHCGAGTNARPAAIQNTRTQTATITPSYPATRQHRKGSWTDWLLPVVAVALILYGIGHIALQVIGRSAMAQVTDLEQVMFVQNDSSTRNPSRYKLEYAFSVDGERYTGSVTRVFTGGSQMRQTLPVRYLAFWPSINAEDADMNPVGLVTLGAGILIMVISVRKYKRKNRS